MSQTKLESTNTSITPDGVTEKDLPQLTMDQAIVLSVITGCVLTPMSNVLRDIASRLGRPVLAEEFRSADFVEQVKDLYREDFLKIIRAEKKSLLILPNS